MIFSDGHSDPVSLEALERAQKDESPDRTICLGDALGYGTHHSECFERTWFMSDVYLLGNHEDALKKAQAGTAPDISTAINEAAPVMSTSAKQKLVEADAQLTPVDRMKLAKLEPSYESDGVLYVHGSPHEPVSWTYVHPLDVFMELLQKNRPPAIKKGMGEIDFKDEKVARIYGAVLRSGPVHPGKIADETGIDVEFVNKVISSMLIETPLLKASLKVGTSVTGNADAKLYMEQPKYSMTGYMEHCKSIGKDDSTRRFFTFNMPAGLVFRMKQVADLDGFFTGHSHVAYLAMDDGREYRGVVDRMEVPEGVKFALNPGTASREENRYGSCGEPTYAVYEKEGSRRTLQIKRIGG